MEDTFEQTFLWNGQPFGAAEQPAQRQSPRVSEFFQIFGQLQRRGRIRVQEVGFELFQRVQIFRQPLRLEVIGREQ